MNQGSGRREFAYTVESDDERSRRAQYREQVHYYRRYTGLTGGFFEWKDNIADGLGEGGRQFAASAFLLLLSIGIISLGWSWWYLLWVPMALMMLASCLMLIWQGISHIVDWWRDLIS